MCVALPVACAPPLYAVTVHVPVPGPLTGRFRAPFTGTEALYETTPVQRTDAEVALLVVQEKLGTLPAAVDTVGLNTALFTVGAAVTERLAVPVAWLPAAFVAVKLQT